MSRAVWRLVRSGPGRGAYNMALDEELLERVAEGRSGPVLRLYAWDPPCVSLGYGQAPGREIDPAACRRAGVEAVRRPTGGRAVLHWHELTYSLVCRRDDPLAGGELEDTYRVVGECLVGGLALLGVGAELERVRGRPRAPRSQTASAPCFSSAARWEVKWGGRKLVGSAQRRWSEAVLQHGSLLTGPGHARLPELLPLPGPQRQRWADALTGASAHLGQCLDPVPDHGRIADALARAFAARLGVEWDTAGLAPEEEAAARARAAEKYADPLPAAAAV